MGARGRKGEAGGRREARGVKGGEGEERGKVRKDFLYFIFNFFTQVGALMLC